MNEQDEHIGRNTCLALISWTVIVILAMSVLFTCTADSVCRGAACG